MLYCGDGIPMNAKEGVSWLEKAAERGNEACVSRHRIRTRVICSSYGLELS